MKKQRAGQKVYNRRNWDRLRKMYMDSHYWICERCGKPATECHHKTHLTPANVDNPNIAFDTANLECLCHDCHNAEHDRFNTRTVYDADANLVNVRPTDELQEFEQARAEIAAMNF